MICIMSFISSVKIIKVVVPGPCLFFLILASIAESDAVIPNGAKICFAKGIANFKNGPANLLSNDPKNPPDCIIIEI